MRQCAARCFHDTDALTVLRPTGRFPKCLVEGARIACLDVADQGVQPILHGTRQYGGLEGTGRGTTQRREDRFDRQFQLHECPVNEFLRRFMAVCEQHKDARERADFHGMAIPAR